MAKKVKKEAPPPAAIIGRSAQPNFLTIQEKAMLSAVIQLIGKFDLSTQLPVGEYPIEGRVIIDLAGLAKKFGQEEYVPTVAIPHKQVLEVLLGKMGAVGPAVEEQVFKALEQAMEEVAKGSINAECLQALSSRREEVEQRVKARLAAMPKRTREGKFCTKGGDVRAIRVEGIVEEEKVQNQDEDADELAGSVAGDD